MVDRVAMWQALLLVLWFPTVNIIPPVLHTLFHLHVAVTRRKNKRSLDTFPRSIAVLEVGEYWTEIKFLLFFKGLFCTSNCHLRFCEFLSFSMRPYPVPGFNAVWVICSILLVFLICGNPWNSLMAMGHWVFWKTCTACEWVPSDLTSNVYWQYDSQMKSLFYNEVNCCGKSHIDRELFFHPGAWAS
jgi:hypothetical protein